MCVNGMCKHGFKAKLPYAVLTLDTGIFYFEKQFFYPKSNAALFILPCLSKTTMILLGWRRYNTLNFAVGGNAMHKRAINLLLD